MPEVARYAARLLVIDPRERVLLFRGLDPAHPERGTWWFTPGGGVEDGEDAATAARRELQEETGIAVAEVGPVVHRAEADYEFDSVRYRQLEDYYLVRVRSAEVDIAGWTELEQRFLVEVRWWPRFELQRTKDIVFPANLVDLLDRLQERRQPLGVVDARRGQHPSAARVHESARPPRPPAPPAISGRPVEVSQRHAGHSAGTERSSASRTTR